MISYTDINNKLTIDTSTILDNTYITLHKQVSQIYIDIHYCHTDLEPYDREVNIVYW